MNIYFKLVKVDPSEITKDTPCVVVATDIGVVRQLDISTIQATPDFTTHIVEGTAAVVNLKPLIKLVKRGILP